MIQTFVLYLERKICIADKRDASGTLVASCSILSSQSIHYQSIRFSFATIV